MNLWKVAIDERSGRVQDAPQPVSTPSEWSALPSLSRDGRRLIYATSSNRSFVELWPFNPETGRVTGPPSEAYQGARAILSCDVSPDGKWLALWATLPTEDLLLVRSDGSEQRSLTNDLARDRTPYWSPDGRRILFASNRGGKYEIWTIRPDGSDLTRVTNLPDQDAFYPSWSPDGKTIGFNYFLHGTALQDLTRPLSRPRVLPSAEGRITFSGEAWSKDGLFLAGSLLRPDGSSSPGIVLWDFSGHTYRRLTRSGQDPMFFHSGTRILFRETDTRIRLVDVASGEVRTVLPPPSQSYFIRVRVAPSDRRLCTVRATDEGDIWSMALVSAVKPE